MDKEFSNIRIVDIAKMAGVSVGTVDRGDSQSWTGIWREQEESSDYSGDGSLSAESDGAFVGI